MPLCCGGATAIFSCAVVAASSVMKPSAIRGQASSSGRRGRNVDDFAVIFKDPISETVEFNPMVPPGRADVDLRGWRKRSLPRRHTKPDTVWSSMFVGPPASQPLSNLRKNSVKMHGASLAVARRNALELAQQLRRPDDCSCDEWPCFDNVLYLPVPDHMNEDTELHIVLIVDDLVLASISKLRVNVAIGVLKFRWLLVMTRSALMLRMKTA